MNASIMRPAARAATREVRAGSGAGRARHAVSLVLLAAGAAGLALGGSPALAAASTIEVVYSFAGGEDGTFPKAHLIEHAGVLYGTTVNGGTAGDCGTVFGLTRPPSVKTFTEIMHSKNGCGPQALAVGVDGHLYGTNEKFGHDNPAINNQGSLFRITTGGVFTRLHLFEFNAPSYPRGGLLTGRDGNLYGTTSRSDGANGNVFRAVPQPGDEVSIAYLHAFFAGSLSRPGAVPLTGLIEDGGLDGVFYGTTSGAGHPDVESAGTLFRITADGTYRLLHAFSRENERASGRLVQAGDGMLYGTTSGGGSHGQGMVFRIATDGSGYQELHSFNAAMDQLSHPNGGLTAGADGHLYGVAGGIFRVTPASGQVARLIPASTVNSITAPLVTGNDLGSELSGLLSGSDGSFYAASSYGGTVSCTGESTVPGTWGCGAVVRIVPGDATNLGGGAGGGDGNGNGNGVGNGGSGSSDAGGGGGDGTTLALLALLLAIAGVLRQRSAGTESSGLAGKGTDPEQVYSSVTLGTAGQWNDDGIRTVG